jgi:hypothetical protein
MNTAKRAKRKHTILFRRSFISVLPKNKMILKGNLQSSFQGLETIFFKSS